MCPCHHEAEKALQMEVNYEADIVYLPENVKIGDRVNVVDNEGRLYTSTRVLKLETSVTSRKRTAIPWGISDQGQWHI